MQQPNWKERIERIPVLGNLVAGFKGVYTLRTWRAAIRNDVAGLSHDHARLAEQLALLERKWSDDTQQLERRLDERFRAMDEAAKLLQSDVGAVRGQNTRIADALGVFQIELNRLHSTLANARRELNELAWSVIQLNPGKPVNSAHRREGQDSDLKPDCVLRCIAADPQDIAQRVAPFRHALGDRLEQPSVLHLHVYAADMWLPLLRQEAGRYNLITALDGASATGAPKYDTLLRAVQSALQADGCFVACFANPENLVVASELLQSEAPVQALAPSRACSLALDLGFSHADVVRFDADDETLRLPGEGAAVERINHLLFGPRRFALIARNG